MDMTTFGKRLKEVRESKHISTEVLGEAIGVNKTTIHRYEKGDFKSIKQDRLEAIAKYLTVDSDYLIGKKENKISFDTIISLNKKENLEVNDILKLTKEVLQLKGVTLNGEPIDESIVWDITYLIDIIIQGATLKQKMKHNKK